MVPVEPAIAVYNLTKVFGKGNVRALDGLSFETEAGTVLGVLGPNGAGKTTAVRILSTVLRADGGRASILGFDVSSQPAKVRKVIGLAGQYAAVDENLSGRQNLHMIGRLSHLSHPAAKQRADALLDQFELTEAANRSIKTYSGGMRRRLDLAAALVAQPPVLFFDEPTTGLDPKTRQDMWAWTEQLVAQGTTVLLTTQYLEEADRLADKIVVVNHGKVIAEGTPAQLKANLGATVLLVTLADAETAKAAASLLAPIARTPPITDGTYVELNVENGPKAGSAALRALDAAGIDLIGLELREPSLDDVFLVLTGHRTQPNSIIPDPPAAPFEVPS